MSANKCVLRATVALLSLFVAVTPLFGQSGHSVKLTWVDSVNPAGQTSYTVYKATGACSSNSSFAKLTSGVTALTFTDANVAFGTFCYQVTATVNGAEGAASNQAGATAAPGSVVLTITVTTP